MQPLISRRASSLKGDITVPGDKSISHRALLLSSQVVGTARITGLLEGEDVLHTAACLKEMGVDIRKEKRGIYRVRGVGTGGLDIPNTILDMGNAGTGARLLMGLVATHPFRSVFTGDESLQKRPMRRVMLPLEQMGARFEAAEGGRLPLTVIGAEMPLPMTYALPVASAQVKSAILLAALNTPGKTTVIEKQPTRDHTELMMRYLGMELESEDGRITLTGQPEAKARDIAVPADPSSAAFPAVAALITPGSEIVIRNVCMNPLRTGLYTTLEEMGADITYENAREEAGEMIADIRVKSSALKGVKVPAERAPSMIDEYPILAVAAAFAEGETRMKGLQELKVKESNRLQATADGLKACGVDVESGEDWLCVKGSGKPPNGCGKVVTHYDHRIAMAFLVMGMASREEVIVDDATAINTSFPGFSELMNNLGAGIA